MQDSSQRQCWTPLLCCAVSGSMHADLRCGVCEQADLLPVSQHIVLPARVQRTQLLLGQLLQQQGAARHWHLAAWVCGG